MSGPEPDDDWPRPPGPDAYAHEIEERNQYLADLDVQAVMAEHDDRPWWCR